MADRDGRPRELAPALPVRTYHANLTITDAPGPGEAYLTEEEIRNQLESWNLDAGINVTISGGLREEPR